MNDDPDLATWLQAAWGRHAECSAELAAELLARAPTLPDSPDGAEALRLATHVILGHERNEALAAQLLAALPAGAAFAPGLRRARWTLAMLRGEPVPNDAPPAERWRGLHELALVWAARGRAAEARQLLLAQGAEAARSDDLAALRGHAAATNNIATDLREQAAHDPAIAALVLSAAEGAHTAWARAGTWQHVERAEYLWARCLATAGQGAAAREHAQACLAICEAEGADAFERFFAHEALAWAARSSGDTAAAAAQRARMAALREEIGEDLRPWCDEALAALADD